MDVSGPTSRHADDVTDGYDLPVYGLAEGRLLLIHVPALCCIGVSLCCAIITIICSFHQHWRCEGHFAQWRQGDRNVVYLALCDGLFNLFHLMDHGQMLATGDHVRPSWLCQILAFSISEFITAQQLLVNAIAVSSFLTVHMGRPVTLGRCDWKLLVYVFGGAFVPDAICLGIGAYGPSGSFCYFDGVRGVRQLVAFCTIPLLILSVSNAVLYVLTWRKVRIEENRCASVLGRDGHAASCAARTGLLFVLAFFVQWWPTSIYGVWSLVQPAPFVVHQLVTIFVNLGGFFNLMVFCVLVRRRARHRQALKVYNRDRTAHTNPHTKVSLPGRGVSHPEKIEFYTVSSRVSTSPQKKQRDRDRWTAPARSIEIPARHASELLHKLSTVEINKAYAPTGGKKR